MPELLRPYREAELRILQGDDQDTRQYQEHDRVYQYAVYNDLGNPDKKNPRPTLGGPDSEFPYPRRGRTNRKPMKTDPKCESRDVWPVIDQFYVPRDERFRHVKMSDFLGYLFKSISAGILPILRQQFDSASPHEFDNFDDIYKLYEGGLKMPQVPIVDELFSQFPLSLIKGIMPAGGDFFMKMPMPKIIKEDKNAWRTDEEFAREMLAGLNPHIITRLTVI
jgi:linoleate 9S-lipoxygenase